MPWWIWLLIAIAAFVGESATMALYLLYFGVAALAVALLSLFGGLPLVQLVVFVALSIGLLGVVRPRTLHLLGRQVPRSMLTNQGVRPDREGIVVEDVDSGGGMVRLGTADFWSARPYEPGVRIAKGSRVRVTHVEGLTAYVEPLPVAASLSPAPSATQQEFAVDDEATVDGAASPS
jgi:membrane protein implicated in regulation of membrane protease activity